LSKRQQVFRHDSAPCFVVGAAEVCIRLRKAPVDRHQRQATLPDLAEVHRRYRLVGGHEDDAVHPLLDEPVEVLEFRIVSIRTRTIAVKVNDGEMPMLSENVVNSTDYLC
jgi:hypothetical protein